MRAENKVVKASELRRGMIVKPFWGGDTESDVRKTLHHPFWDHIVIGATSADYVTLARPYGYAHEHFDSRSALIGMEVYDIQKTSTQLFLAQKDTMLI